ncbi:hypothetical protein EOH85_10135 [Salmonella enterica]|nr:hypothetical protein [Salmonella enterica]
MQTYSNSSIFHNDEKNRSPLIQHKILYTLKSRINQNLFLIYSARFYRLQTETNKSSIHWCPLSRPAASCQER